MVFVAGLTLEEVKEKVVLHLRKCLSDDLLGLKKNDGKPVEPKDSDRVSVDVVGHNSKVYYVQGDVGSPARLPITGHETVLDAINQAGGLRTGTIAGAKVLLLRPNFESKAEAAALKVDLAAIINRGDSTTNYRIVTGDRLLVYGPEDASVASKTSEKRRQVEQRIDALMKELAELKSEIVQ